VKLSQTPHRFYQFDNPTHAPFDQAATRWPTIVGRFFAPICRARGVDGFVFLDHGAADIELRLACRDYKAVELKMDRLAQSLGIRRRPGTMTPGQTVGNGAFRGADWINPAREKQWVLARRRSELLFRFLHAGCALYLDTLEAHGDQFRPEQINALPLHNLFERCQHLIANFSEAEFDVLVTPPPNPTAMTGGMVQAVSPKAMDPAGQLFQLHL
jgi:hypothetical protein